MLLQDIDTHSKRLLHLFDKSKSCAPLKDGVNVITVNTKAFSYRGMDIDVILKGYKFLRINPMTRNKLYSSAQSEKHEAELVII